QSRALLLANIRVDTYYSKTSRAILRPSYMPPEGISKHSYLFCQFIEPEDAHEGGCCDCFDTAAQKAKARAKAKLEHLRTWSKTTSSQESAVPSNPAVTPYKCDF